MPSASAKQQEESWCGLDSQIWVGENEGEEAPSLASQSAH